MKKEKVFVVSDIHGELVLMKKLLENWNTQEEQLVILGDLADRGKQSKETLELAYHLALKEDAVVVKGNHDEMLELYLEDPIEKQAHYYRNGGETTIYSLLGADASRKNHKQNAAEIKRQYPWLLPFLKSLNYFYEWEDYLFVHAGVDLSLADWRDSTERDFIWIREGFYDQPNTTNKTIVFGHTPTNKLHEDPSNFDIWKSGDGLVGIDGSAVYGGKLHGLVLSNEGIDNHYFEQNDSIKEK